MELQTDASYMDTMTNRIRWRTSTTRSKMIEILGINDKPIEIVEVSNQLELDLKERKVDPTKGKPKYTKN